MRFEDGVLLHWLLPFDPLRNKRVEVKGCRSLRR
jgi:hypothetical protein